MKQGASFERCIVIDDDEDILLSARLLLRDLFKHVATFQSPEEALAAMGEGLPDVILLDANFGRGATNAAEGFQWLAEILKRDAEAVVVMITAHGTVDTAVEEVLDVRAQRVDVDRAVLGERDDDGGDDAGEGAHRGSWCSSRAM